MLSFFSNRRNCDSPNPSPPGECAFPLSLLGVGGTLAGERGVEERVPIMGHRPLPDVRDFTRDGRWSTYDVSVRKIMGGICAVYSLIRDAHRPVTL